MNYYKRHLGDYAKSLSNLSQGQVGAYDLLLDWHYANERPLPLDQEELYIIGRCRSKPERDNVDRVLRYFDKTNEGYIQKRALEEIEKYQEKAGASRENGKLGGRPKGTQKKPSGFSDETQGKPKNNLSHKPLANREEEAGAHASSDAPPPKRKKRKADGVTLTAYLESCKAEGVKPIPEDDGVFGYAERVGLPADFVVLAWRWFKRKYGPEGKGADNRQANWRAHFRNAVEGGWPDYWAINSAGEYYLKTAGKQAEREAQA